MDLQTTVFGLIATVAGVVFFFRGFRDFRMRRMIQNTPTVRIRSMPMGLVELSGTAEPRSVLSAPFSGRPCAFWEVDISTRSRRNTWAVVHRNASGHPFFLRDDTGVALVYPQGATCRMNAGVEEECVGVALPECYSNYLKEQHLAMSTLWRAGAMRFRERLIEPGQAVFVLGTATPKAHAISVSDDDALAATGTDDPRGSALRQLDARVTGVIRRGESERTFILSEQSERDLTLTLGLRSGAELIGGPLLTLFGMIWWLDAVAALLRR